MLNVLCVNGFFCYFASILVYYVRKDNGKKKEKEPFAWRDAGRDVMYKHHIGADPSRVDGVFRACGA
ncbi:cell division protein FtsX [Prevotella sp. MGM1]|nr:cell division protein FtsX [Prevotella sp. MGM1]